MKLNVRKMKLNVRKMKLNEREMKLNEREMRLLLNIIGNELSKDPNNTSNTPIYKINMETKEFKKFCEKWELFTKLMRITEKLYPVKATKEYLENESIFEELEKE